MSPAHLLPSMGPLPPSSALRRPRHSPLSPLSSPFSILHSSLAMLPFNWVAVQEVFFMFVNQVHYGFSSTLVSHLVTCAALLTYQYPKVSLHFSSLDPSFTFLKHLV